MKRIGARPRPHTAADHYANEVNEFFVAPLASGADVDGFSDGGLGLRSPEAGADHVIDEHEVAVVPTRRQCDLAAAHGGDDRRGDESPCGLPGTVDGERPHDRHREPGRSRERQAEDGRRRLGRAPEGSRLQWIRLVEGTGPRTVLRGTANVDRRAPWTPAACSTL
jgi:hypothetical protein